MKKLLIASSIALAAIVSQAAGFSWRSGMGDQIYDGTASATLYQTAGATTLYLFMAQATDTAGTAGSTLQSSVFSSLAQGAAITSLGAYTTTELSDTSAITAKSWTDADQVGKSYDAFFATVFKNADDKDSFYISSLLNNKQYGSSTTMSVAWSDLYSTSTATLDAANGWQGASVYEAVPEPFSGSLALLGMGLVALRRKLKKQKKG